MRCRFPLVYIEGGAVIGNLQTDRGADGLPLQQTWNHPCAFVSCDMRPHFSDDPALELVWRSRFDINGNWRRLTRRFGLCMSGAAVAFTFIATVPAAIPITQWQRWERQLTSATEYANPCTDVKISVRFHGPTGQTRTALGFWDGGRRFLIRGVFPTAGEWHWQTTCSDTNNLGLHNQSGTVRVKRTSGTDALAQHGYLRVSEDGRLLVHADGTPFLWIGDTCWAAPVHATDAEWAHYVSNRVTRGYSMLQLSIAPEWALDHAPQNLPPPFLSKLPDITQPNPAFFQHLDRRLALANDQGLVVMISGLMETPHRYPPPEQIAVFSRYVAARYSSFEVIFSPSFDSPIREAETLAAVDAVREAAPASLVTMHMGTGVGPRFHAADWLAFDMYQSGHNGGNRAQQSARAIGMPADILALAPRKPVINGEAIYEGELGGAFDVRRTAWLSFLSGAVGYTAGINEVYRWTDQATAMMNVPSSDMIALLARVLRAVPWWQLEPQPKRILNQPEDRAAWMALAFTADKTVGLAYLPQNTNLVLNLDGLAPRYEVLWINPATGESIPDHVVTAAPEVQLTAPNAKDWVALLATPQNPVLAQVKKALERVAYRQPPSPLAISFGMNAAPVGLVRKSPRDGMFTNTTFRGVPCLLNESPQRNRYLYLDLDDRIAFRGGVNRMRVEVRLQSDEPLEQVQLQFDAAGAAEIVNTYRSTASAWLKRDGIWSTVGFVAEAPYLGNRQNGGADFRVDLGGLQCRIASLQVFLE